MHEFILRDPNNDQSHLAHCILHKLPVLAETKTEFLLYFTYILNFK